MSKVRALFMKRYWNGYTEPKFFFINVDEKEIYSEKVYDEFVTGLKRKRLRKMGDFLFVRFFSRGVIIFKYDNVEKVDDYQSLIDSGGRIFFLSNKEFSIIEREFKKYLGGV